MNRLVIADPGLECRASVVVPVCNEENNLRNCLNALLHQSLPHQFYEVVVLLNNCTDSSPQIARQFQQEHPAFALHLVERWLPKKNANVGTARRMLMEEASQRLPSSGAILSTDGDTTVASNWVARNLELLTSGMDAVGGDITLHPGDFAKLPASSRRQYTEDARYLSAVTRLESLLDPDPHDPWPRHHHHFGASLACTNALYTQVGGLPKADCLEDVAFVNAIMRADAKLRHSPDVTVVTAARTTGRARIGLASQLREWHASHEEPLVDSAPFLKTYFAWRAHLRAIWNCGTLLRNTTSHELANLIGMQCAVLQNQLETASTFGSLLQAIDLRGRLWHRTAPVRRVGKRAQVTEQITLLAESLLAAGHQSGSAPACSLPFAPIRNGRESIHVPDLQWRDNPGQVA